MKGRMCRSNGGAAKMRDIGGIKAPSYGSGSAVMKMAEGKTTGMAAMDGPNGGPAKTRLDRPGRKHGGSVKHEHMKEHKADGGRAPMELKLKEGALHKSLGVKEGDKIPEKKLEKAEHSENPLMKKRAVFAENAKHWKHGKK